MPDRWTADDALASFCGRLYPRLVGALVLEVRDRGRAEELAQETLVRVCERWDDVRTMDRPEAWAFTVALNLARSWWRRSAAAARALGRLGREPPPPDPLDLETRQLIRDAVAALPPRQRRVVILRHVAGLSVAKTAAAMGCAEGTVKSLTHKAARNLRRVVERAEVDP